MTTLTRATASTETTAAGTATRITATPTQIHPAPGKNGKPALQQPTRLPLTANEEMNLTDLQLMAKDRGIPFGGMSVPRLVRRINNFSY